MGVITERERQKYFAYLNGVADGLNESRNDVNSVLDKIRAEIKAMSTDYCGGYIGLDKKEVLQIIDKYREEQE